MSNRHYITHRDEDGTWYVALEKGIITSHSTMRDATMFESYTLATHIAAYVINKGELSVRIHEEERLGEK